MANTRSSRQKKHGFENTPPTDPKITQPGAPYATNARNLHSERVVSASQGDRPRNFPVPDTADTAHGEFMFPRPQPAKPGKKVHRFDDQ